MALMKSPTGNGVPLIVKLIAEKSGLPTRAAIRGVSRSLVNAVTTDPKAAPMTTPTARSTTLPRRMNCLKPLSMEPPKREGANLGRSRRLGQAEPCRSGRPYPPILKVMIALLLSSLGDLTAVGNDTALEQV